MTVLRQALTPSAALKKSLSGISDSYPDFKSAIYKAEQDIVQNHDLRPLVHPLLSTGLAIENQITRMGVSVSLSCGDMDSTCASIKSYLQLQLPANMIAGTIKRYLNSMASGCERTESDAKYCSGNLTKYAPHLKNLLASTKTSEQELESSYTELKKRIEALKVLTAVPSPFVGFLPWMAEGIKEEMKTLKKELEGDISYEKMIWAQMVANKYTIKVLEIVVPELGQLASEVSALSAHWAALKSSVNSVVDDVDEAKKNNFSGWSDDLDLIKADWKEVQGLADKLR